MPESPLAITLANSAADEPSIVELEVSFVAEDEPEPLDHLLFANNRARPVEPAGAPSPSDAGRTADRDGPGRSSISSSEDSTAMSHGDRPELSEVGSSDSSVPITEGDGPERGGVGRSEGSIGTNEGDRPQHGGVSGRRQESGQPGGGSSSLAREGPGGGASLESGRAGGGRSSSRHSGGAGSDSDAPGHGGGGIGDGGGAGLLAVRQAAVALGARILGGAGAVHVLGGMPLRAVVGLGPRAEITLETLRRAAAHAIGCATDLRRATLAIDVPSSLPPAITATAAVEAIVEGALLAAHARTPRATLSPKADALVPPGRCVLRLSASASPASASPPDPLASLGSAARARAPTNASRTAESRPVSTGPPESVPLTATSVTAGGEIVTTASARVTSSPATVTSPGASVTEGDRSVTPTAASVTPGEGSIRRGDDHGVGGVGGVGRVGGVSGHLPGAAQLDAALIRAHAHAAAVRLARELADMPANRLSPVQLAEQAVAAVADLDDVSTHILDVEDLERLGAGLLLAVGSGSTRPPALGILRYNPPGATLHVAVVGKGITFDAGGINIKPAKGMGDMVHDKAGAAAAAAIAYGAATLRLPIAVTALLACAENLPSGAAYRPGDVLLGLDGATVEVIDTDAEGRLVLADALTYALRMSDPRQPDVLVDLATLTGSIVSALGNEAAGLFANDDGLALRMLEAAARAGEPLWRMPILPGHRAQLKSERADRKQCAERWGDCAIAAAFLEMYVDKRPWLHLDIAGVAYNEGSPEWPAYHPKTGAAGTGVRTVLHFLEGLAMAHDPTTASALPEELG